MGPTLRLTLLPIRKRYELIAGERRLRAIRDYTELETIHAQIVTVDDLQARRISAAENMQREDLSAIEVIDAIVEIVDADLIQDKEYATVGKTPDSRLKALLGKLDSARRSKDRGYENTCPLVPYMAGGSDQATMTSHKFMGRVEQMFRNLPNPLEWRSFYNNGLPLLIDFWGSFRDGEASGKLQGRTLVYKLTGYLNYDI
jgi:hypothetical protein